MKLLLDTHVAIWAVASPQNLPAEIAALITHPNNRPWVSVITLTEIAIKFPLARSGIGAMPFGCTTALERFQDASFEFLDVSPRHALALERLPMIHRDPFDRLLVAQAIEESMRLVTHDAAVAAYGDTVIYF